MAARTDPTGADPSRLRRDVADLSGMITTLSREDSNMSDLQQLASAQRGLGAFAAALAQLHQGNLVGYLADLRQGGAAIRGLAGAKLAICTGALT
jgi:hypothetical protein